MCLAWSSSPKSKQESPVVPLCCTLPVHLCPHGFSFAKEPAEHHGLCKQGCLITPRLIIYHTTNYNFFKALICVLSLPCLLLISFVQGLEILGLDTIIDGFWLYKQKGLESKQSQMELVLYCVFFLNKGKIYKLRKFIVNRRTLSF